MAKPAPEIRWIHAGIIAGLAASVLYPVLLLLPPSVVGAAVVAALVGLWHPATTNRTWRSLGWAPRSLLPPD